MLENLIQEFFAGFKIFSDLKSNHYTSTNEVDITVKLSAHGKILRAQKLIPEWIPDRIIIECKNYNRTVGITYVGKFFSVLNSHNVELGIFISSLGVSARSKWTDSKGFIRKTALMHCLLEGTRRRLILDFSLPEIYAFLESDNMNIIKFLEKAYDDLFLEIKREYDLDCKPHENDGKLFL